LSGAKGKQGKRGGDGSATTVCREIKDAGKNRRWRQTKSSQEGRGEEDTITLNGMEGPSEPSVRGKLAEVVPFVGKNYKGETGKKKIEPAFVGVGELLKKVSLKVQLHQGGGGKK